MRVTYQAGTNTATNGTALGNAGEDVRVFKLIVGAPVSAGNIYLTTITNPVGSSPSNIAMRVTFPSFSTTNVNPGVYELDFGRFGLPLNDGGSLVIDQTMNVSVLWDIADNSML